MFNLKKVYGSFKGAMGEYMFKIAKDRAFITRFHGREKYFKMYGSRFDKNQRDFLIKNWYSIDAIEILESGEKVLYEVKTKNKYKRFLPFKPKMTQNSHNLYLKAKDLGFTVKIGLIELAENWEYTLTILDFDKKYYCLDKFKQYDFCYKNSKLFKKN